MPKFCVEYYSNTMGNGVKTFDSSDDRDLYLHNLAIDNFYLYEE